LNYSTTEPKHVQNSPALLNLANQNAVPLKLKLASLSRRLGTSQMNDISTAS